MKMFLLLFCFLFVASAYCQESGPVLTIPDGQLRGSSGRTVELQKSYYSFRGIPFAKPPLGDLRFADPVKNDPWNGILDATDDKDGCIQVRPPIGSVNVIGSEDCLHVNVYTPSLNGSLPVMFWIHGGEFMAGSGSYKEHGPDHFLDQDVVYVAFNYRLGVLGFLSTGDSVAPGNWGLKDQVLALKWTKDNIRYFGGDPEKITIFGQSAGAASVAYLLTAPQTKGLYRAAIMQSGTSLCLWSLARDAQAKAFKYGLSQGIVTLNSTELITRLRKVDAADLKVADSGFFILRFLLDDSLAGLPFAITEEKESENAILSGKTHELISTGQFNQVPVLMGYNSKEAGVVTDTVDLAKPLLFFYDRTIDRLAPYSLTDDATNRSEAGKKIRGFYCDNSTLTDKPIVMVDLISIDQFNRPIREAGKQFSKYVNTYFYKFSYEGSLGNPNRKHEGVEHSEELNYLFLSNNPHTSDDLIVRKKMVSMWTNFAKYLNPTPDDSTLDGIVWKPNSPGTNTSTEMNYLSIDNSISMNLNPNQDSWEFYQDIFDTYGVPPYDTY